ncbi:MAG: hypothetical protein RIT28_4304, partial [Pseudomonadota bacterium]
MIRAPLARSTWSLALLAVVSLAVVSLGAPGVFAQDPELGPPLGAPGG